MANFRVALERLVYPQLFRVLSGNEVPHVVNDATHRVASGTYVLAAAVLYLLIRVVVELRKQQE